MTGVVLVTGGSRGIGRATVVEFAQAGWRVAVNYRKRDDAASELVARFPDRVRKYRCDVTDEAAVSEMVASITSELGPIDVLVNNAGLWRGAPVQRLSSSDFRAVLDVTLVGAKNATAAVLGEMRARGSGHILNVSSAVGVTGWAGDSAYAAAKAGLLGMTSALAKELAPFGVQVNAIVPGYIETDMTDGVSESQRRALLDRTLLHGAGRPEDVGAMIYAVATVGRFMTGAVIAVDGGMILGRDGPSVRPNTVKRPIPVDTARTAPINFPARLPSNDQEGDHHEDT